MISIETFRTVLDAHRAAVRLHQAINALDRWAEVLEGQFDATPASTSQIRLDTTDLATGVPIKYAQGGVDYYAIIGTIGTNVINIGGPPLDTSKPIEMLWIGRPEMVVQDKIYVQGAYAAGAASYVNYTVGGFCREWAAGPARLVNCRVIHKVNDTGAAQPYVNPNITSNTVCTLNSGKGINVNNAGWQGTSVGIDPAKYSIVRAQAYGIDVTVAGTNGDAEHLSVNFIFVLE